MKVKMSRPAFSSILFLWVAAPFMHHMVNAALVPETQTKSSYNLTGSSSIETNIFLPTLSSDTMSFTKLSDFTQNKRFKPRLPKKIVPNEASTTEPSITTSDIEKIDTEDKGGDELDESSSPSPTSLLAKRNFFRRRRKPDIKATLGVSEEFEGISTDNLSEQSKNETAVDIIMQKIKRAQKFKSGRKSFHSSAGVNKNRKRLIKNRARFRPPITTDTTIPNTSTAPILATNEKLMRIAANRRKKLEEEKLTQNQIKNSSRKNIKIKNLSSKRRPFSKTDWSKKTKKPSLVGEKLKAMREKRKNKYQKLKTKKSRVQLSSVDDNEDEMQNSNETQITTEISSSTDSNSPETTQKSHNAIFNKYPRVIRHRPVKKPDEKTIETSTRKDAETPSISTITDDTTQQVMTEQPTKIHQKDIETVFSTEKNPIIEDNTTEKIESKPRIVGYKVTKSNIKQKINRKTTFTKAKKPKYSFRPKGTTSKMLLKEKIETSKSLKKLNKEQPTTTIPSITIKKTTDQPNDLKLSATTQRFEESTSSIQNKSAISNDKSSENEIANEPEPEVEPETIEPKPEPPTQPKLDWSEKRKHRNALFKLKNRKNFLKGSFIRVEDSQFSASENEEYIVGDFPVGDTFDIEQEESADPEDIDKFQTLYDIDTFGAKQFSQEYEDVENITPKIKRKILADNAVSEQTLKAKIQDLRNEVISSIIEKYPTEVLVSKDSNNDEYSTIKASGSIESTSLDSDFSGSGLIQTLDDLDTEEGKQQITSIGVESLASLVNLPSSFDSINDEDNFIFTDRYPSKKNPSEISSKIFSEDNIVRRQDSQKIQLIDVVESENQANRDIVKESLDNKIISELEKILEIHVPEDSRIRRKNSINRIIRQQNPFGQNHVIPSNDFVDVLPNGTSLVRLLHGAKYMSSSPSFGR